MSAEEPITATAPGATLGADGAWFTLWAQMASSVTLCLFDDDGVERRIELHGDDGRWSVHVPGVAAGQRYGFRVDGPWDPVRGLLCDPSALLLDPYARAIDGVVSPHDAVYQHQRGVETAPYVPRSVVVDPTFDWSGDTRPDVPPAERIIYETHVKGLTMRHPDVPDALRGTYAGLAHPAVIDHLVGLGITTIELMPIHQFVHGRFLHERGLRNYWGYDSIGYFAPHAGYASAGGGGQVAEFKTMVQALHAAGLEVFIDVVYNHTGEGDHRGPTLSFRGIDDGGSYRSDPADRRRYVDITGTGNSVDMRAPAMLGLVLESLRYWVTDMHIDGFRFDLATTLARTDHGFDAAAPFLEHVAADPLLRDVTLIAEPWDIGPDGYQLGGFPAPWAEWNGRYRDNVRELWLGAADALPEFGRRFTGSADLFEPTDRGPLSSVNYVTTHDGFTLHDLVSYDHKHNEANGEGGADGEDDNRSWNGGAEGPTGDPAINALRARRRRGLLATLLLSQGTPMLLGGDEIGRSQSGNNNAYCQDNEVSWTDWHARDEDLEAFVRRLIALRRAHPELRHPEWLRAADGMDGRASTIVWLSPDGRVMDDEDWEADPAGLGVALGGESRFYLIFNPAAEARSFVLPPDDGLDHRGWSQVFDTALDDPFEPPNGRTHGGGEVRLQERSMMLLTTSG